jgi:Zn-dependent M32 family carboxypeptidase
MPLKRTLTCRVDEEMFKNIKADIESNRQFGIRTIADVINAALTDRYAKEKNFWNSIDRRLNRAVTDAISAALADHYAKENWDALTGLLDRQKSRLQVFDKWFKRIEETLIPLAAALLPGFLRGRSRAATRRKPRRCRGKRSRV